MSILNFSQANCKNCYKCLRVCPVKAIKIKNEQAEIVEDLCIGCGQCLVVCPQNARQIKSDLQEVKDAIKSKRKVVASIAPTFAGAFSMTDARQIVSALNVLGFSIVEETAIGAEIVAKLYKKYLDSGKYKNLITTSCPSGNYLVEKYFPSLIKYLAPVVSPMIAHGKLLKHEYGMDSYTVFIGPCTGKKIESINFQHKGTIDAVLTFEELTKWLEEENIILSDLVPKPFDGDSSKKGCGFPLEGGVLKSFLNEDKTKYEVIKVDGIDQCMKIFQSIENDHIENVCIEVNTCRGSCVGGSGMPKEEKDFYKSQRKIKEYVKSKKDSLTDENYKDLEHIEFSKKFFDRNIDKKKASEEEIIGILRKIGKYEPEDELNCGGCGYNTCREKAQAVYEGMAELNMCLPFMRSKAERLTNVIFENTPNIIILVDEEMHVKEFNPTAERIFNIKAEEIKDKPISVIMDENMFRKVKETKKDFIGHKVAYSQYGVVLLQSILYLEKQNVLLAIMTNTTSEEKHKKELVRVKEKTIDAAQKVIEKQMRVAQEIASLLGETTAETKIILTKLKQITLDENGDAK
ncbi:[Fe-Fe] hydrogenase large subunit C-terminal domain-containing protein [Crassaminicella profunda]|uniref:[Fe-Fe] hydrogenase large subunit C-terminal domain-containing protein n=1 Tax=Crassaminicella profunda TaxID=1286698 RepID=UPI001CA67AE3|nr:[Fe-Fe] hydrogenase large subunit C-terminal domain-containing protein [Crassaminicella profunda]QZY54584.1 4Fe-4S binding protein [Crassaminicella profunda]